MFFFSIPEDRCVGPAVEVRVRVPGRHVVIGHSFLRINLKLYRMSHPGKALFFKLNRNYVVRPARAPQGIEVRSGLGAIQLGKIILIIKVIP